MGQKKVEPGLLRVVPENILAAITLSRFRASHGVFWDIEQWKKLFKSLQDREQYVIYCRFFLGLKLEQVGNDMDVSRERVRQIESDALACLVKLEELQDRR
jgi:DNA-directed RNA polymerase specialized sigma24 family protein